tara:strand:+ start:209 stop:370 length:162 start_codon:yes stop_codon:yes gene_type:complete
MKYEVIELTPTVVECLKRGLNCWAVPNGKAGDEIRGLLATVYKTDKLIIGEEV